MYHEQAFWLFSIVIALCKADHELDISSCVQDCKDKSTFLSHYQYLCGTTCLKAELKKIVTEATGNNFDRTLPKPATPTLNGEAGYRAIPIRFNTTELKTYDDLHYVLEIESNSEQQERKERSDRVFVFPYRKIYRHINETTYVVDDLEPSSGYRFRVIALKLNKSSPFSNWSDVINSTMYCRKIPCGPTNAHLELMVRKRERGRRNENLINSTFRWKRDATASEKNKTYLGDITFTLSRIGGSGDNCKDFSPHTKLGWNVTSYSYDKQNKRLYFGCWYKLKTKAEALGPIGLPIGSPSAEREWIFHVPDCISTRNGDNVCGNCSRSIQIQKDGHINASRIRNTNQTLGIFFNWSTELWKNVKLGYFRVVLQGSDKMTEFTENVNASASVSQYNLTIGNLTEGKKYYLYILAYRFDHCEQNEIARLQFTATLPCDYADCNVRKPNSTCQPTADLNSKAYECKCDDGFYGKDGKCIDQFPCKTWPCGKNEICTVSITAENGRNCTCQPPNIRSKNEQCVIPVSEENDKLNKGVIVAAVLAPLLVVLIAVCTIFWLRKRHEKRLNFMEKEMELAVGFGQMNSYLRTVNPDILADDNSERVLNLIYVSQDNAYEIPAYLLEPINLLELPEGSIRLHSIIGRGEFGKVYLGDAQGINKDSEWTTVAIKTLTESANEEEVSDFLREIELMKDIGKHENVIQMYGCCTRCRPICLVLEYAPGGNLLNYLRSLKKKCKDIAVARLAEVAQSNKEKHQNHIEAGNDVPEDYVASLLPNENGEQYVQENTIKQAQEFNLEIASKIKEEVCHALNPKELECFARQIATGMKHVSDLRVVHRDLAARNILIGEHKVLKISDFGLSREGTYVKKSSGKIPFRWLSIEAIQERTYSTASDVWAFGVVLWEICTLGDVPYSSIADRNLRNFLLGGNRLEKVGSCTDGIYDIMLKCWSHVPEERPTFDQLTKKLWDLEHSESSYVNLNSLLRQSMESEEEEKDDQENNTLHSSDSDDTSSVKQLVGSISGNKNFENKGFQTGEEDINANAGQLQLA